MERLEQTPTEPLMMLVDHEAQEVFPYVLRKYQDAHLVMMKGIRYITITDDAIRAVSYTHLTLPTKA